MAAAVIILSKKGGDKNTKHPSVELFGGLSEGFWQGVVSLGLVVLEMRARFVSTFYHPFRDNQQKEVVMFSKILSRSAVSVLGFVFALSICIGLSGNTAIAENPPGFDDLPDVCGNNDEFTTEFRLEDCKFKNKGSKSLFHPQTRLPISS